MKNKYQSDTRTPVPALSTTPVLLPPSTVLILGQDPLLQQSIVAPHTQPLFEFIVVSTPTAALSILLNRAVAAVVINLTTLGLNGYHICAEIRNQSLVPIIMTSADKHLEDLVASFEAGADHYIITPFVLEELVVRILATQRRMNLAQTLPSRIILGDLMLDPVRQEVHIKDTMIELTANESRLLHYLARNANCAIRTEDLLELLWGYGSKEDLSVVRTTMHRLRNKIEANPGSPKYIKTVFGLGYRFCTHA